MNATTLVDTVVGLADADDKLDDETKYLILAALEGEEALDDVVGGRGRPAATVASDVVEAEPVGAFLSQIAVSGFRGIGETATLTLQPGPGITVVSGRNGSGKSSFAEAFELPSPATATAGATRPTVDAAAGATFITATRAGSGSISPSKAPRRPRSASTGPPMPDLDDRTVWTQVAGEKRQPGLARLGWGAATELYRPILSYDELGGLFEEGPSKLYDALAKLLGLDEIHDAEKRIAPAGEVDGQRRARPPNEAVRDLKARCAESDDERAAEAATAAAVADARLDAVERLATGTRRRAGPDRAAADRRRRRHPGHRAVAAAAAAFRTAVARAADTTSEALTLADRQSALIRAALGVYELTGDTTCPVCGEGALDAQWKAHALEESARVEELLQRRPRPRGRSAVGPTRAARRVRRRRARPGFRPAPRSRRRPSTRSWSSRPANSPPPSPNSPTSSSSPPWRSRRRSSSSSAEAAADLAALEAEWAPLAGDLVKWVALEREARAHGRDRQVADRGEEVGDGERRRAAQPRLLPLAEQAREIWSQLRQESNVDLQAITLGGHQHAAAACRWRRRWTASPPGRCR